MPKQKNQSSASIRPGEELSGLSTAAPLSDEQGPTFVGQARYEFCDKCRRVRRRVARALLIATFPIIVPIVLLIMLLVIVLPRATPGTISRAEYVDMDEETYQKERELTRERLRCEDAKVDARRRRRMQWLTLGLLPKKVLDCFVPPN